MTWCRESATLASGPLRSEGGILTRWPPAIELGEPCVLRSDPINPPWQRIVVTTRIVAFLETPAVEPAEGVA